MIKINLAKRKRAQTLAKGASNPGAGSFSLGKGLSIDLGALKNFNWRKSPFTKVLIYVLLAYVAQVSSDSAKEDRLAEVEGKIKEVRDAQNEVNKKLAQIKGFEPLKKRLEDDEKAIQLKLSVISSLLADRDAPVKLLKQISQVIPEEAWLTSIDVKESKMTLQGGASNYGVVSDFLKGLNESTLVADVTPNSVSETSKDGIKYQLFDISAKRKNFGLENDQSGRNHK